MDNKRGCEYCLCDFCKFYMDEGTMSPKRGGFSGIGNCDVTNKEVLASDGCEEYFVCKVCQSEILNNWGCV